MAAAMLAFNVGGPAFADVDGDGQFELEGDAIGSAAPGDDWSDLISSPGGSDARTAIPIHEGEGVMILTGGNTKDFIDIPSWKHSTGSVPPKDQLLDAFAASYTNTLGEQVIYFGADRITTEGSAQMGFWFFQDEVAPDPDNPGKFIGKHTINDILALVEFTNGGTVATVDLYRWVGSGGDQHKGTLQSVVAAGAGLCSPAATNQTVCAIANNASTNNTAPWAYVPKSGPAGVFPPLSFFEGGVNISQLFGGNICFTSFLAETRSSHDVPSVLKDVILGSFPVCEVTLSKVCNEATFNKTTGLFTAPYTITIQNSGAGAVQDIDVTDNNCTPSNTADDSVFSNISLAGGASTTRTGSCVFAPPDEADLPILNGVSAVADGGETSVNLASSCTLGTDPNLCQDECEVPSVDPAIEVDKKCTTALVDAGDTINVRVNFEGTVCNTSSGAGAVDLENVTAVDNSGTSDTSDDQALTLLDGDGNPTTTLAAGECATYTGSYDPSSTNSTCPGNAEFIDTVTASGDDVVFGDEISDSDSASCKLCPPEGCPQTPSD